MISFFVPGKPATQGSKRAFYSPKANRAFVVEDCKRNKSWRSDVRNEAQKVWSGNPFDGAVVVRLTFFLPRPKGHLNAKGQVKPTVNQNPITKPDLTKLARCVEDALKGLVWKDDSQIVQETIIKHYNDLKPCGVQVDISYPEDIQQ